jgi:hypothetical protein
MAKPLKELTRSEREARYLKYRIDVLPDQLERVRLRHLHLCREAKRLGMDYLLTPEELTTCS